MNNGTMNYMEWDDAVELIQRVFKRDLKVDLTADQIDGVLRKRWVALSLAAHSIRHNQKPAE